MGNNDIQQEFETLKSEIAKLATIVRTNAIINRVTLDLLVELKAEICKLESQEVKLQVNKLLKLRENQIIDGSSLL